MVDVLTNLKSANMVVVATAVVPDEIDQIQKIVTNWADTDAVDLILTSGGTGFSPRDVTPEAIKVIMVHTIAMLYTPSHALTRTIPLIYWQAILHKEIPGFVIAMLEDSRKITAKAILSRPVAGIRAQTLILTLPGKPKAVYENFAAIEDVLPHALHLVRDVPHEHHRASPSSLYT